MGTLNTQQYLDAISRWNDCRSNLTAIELAFAGNSIFNIDNSQVRYIREHNRNKEFCAEIGIIDPNQLIIILTPLDETGNAVMMEEYQYSYFKALESDICLTEKQTYSVVKKSVLSSDMKKVNNDDDVFLPVMNKPIIGQDKAVEAIQLWQENAFDWFYAEQNINGGKDIFKKFYVPADKFADADSGVRFVTVFGLKYSAVYNKQLPALIFIAFYDALLGQSMEVESNTYDYAKPCPPLCNVQDLG